MLQSWKDSLLPLWEYTQTRLTVNRMRSDCLSTDTSNQHLLPVLPLVYRCTSLMPGMLSLCLIHILWGPQEGGHRALAARGSREKYLRWLKFACDGNFQTCYTTQHKLARGHTQCYTSKFSVTRTLHQRAAPSEWFIISTHWWTTHPHKQLSGWQSLCKDATLRVSVSVRAQLIYMLTLYLYDL